MREEAGLLIEHRRIRTLRAIDPRLLGDLLVILRDHKAVVTGHDPPDRAILLGLRRIGRKKERDESVLGPVGKTGRQTMVRALGEPLEFGRRFVAEFTATALL